jgi:hypothetical protein
MSPKTIPMHASVAGAHAREVSGIRFRATAVIGVPSVSISKVYVKRSFAQNCYTSEGIRQGEAVFRVVSQLEWSDATGHQAILPKRVRRGPATISQCRLRQSAHA